MADLLFKMLRDGASFRRLIKIVGLQNFMFQGKLSMNSKRKQKIKLKLWPVSNFKAPIQFAFMKIFSFAERQIRFGLQNFIIQALRLCQVLFVIFNLLSMT